MSEEQIIHDYHKKYKTLMFASLCQNLASICSISLLLVKGSKINLVMGIINIVLCVFSLIFLAYAKFVNIKRTRCGIMLFTIAQSVLLFSQGDIGNDQEAIWGTILIVCMILLNLFYLAHVTQEYKIQIRMMFILTTGLGVCHRIYGLNNF